MCVYIYIYIYLTTCDLSPKPIPRTLVLLSHICLHGPIMVSANCVEEEVTAGYRWHITAISTVSTPVTAGQLA